MYWALGGAIVVLTALVIILKRKPGEPPDQQ